MNPFLQQISNQLIKIMDTQNIIKEKESSLLISKTLFEKLQRAKESGGQSDIDSAIEQILMSQMFQMLNDYPIPPKYCLHLRQIVYPQDGGFKPYQCLSCATYLS